MKLVYRNGMFETNSSSTHSMIIGMEDDFKKWEAGKLFYDRHTGSFCTKEEAIEYLKNCKWYKDNDFDNMSEEDLMEWLQDANFVSYDEFSDNEYLETDYNTFTTPKGETICMVCKYGYDG